MNDASRLEHRRLLLADLPKNLLKLAVGTSAKWQCDWRDMPVKAWIGDNLPANARTFFRLHEGRTEPRFSVTRDQTDHLSNLVQELVDCRLAAYEVRKAATTPSDNFISYHRPQPERTELPYFTNIKIACGHFRNAHADAEEHRAITTGHGRLDPTRYFIARASRNSMNGGKHSIRDGDYLLLELLGPANAVSITGAPMAIERQEERR